MSITVATYSVNSNAMHKKYKDISSKDIECKYIHMLFSDIMGLML